MNLALIWEMILIKDIRSWTFLPTLAYYLPRGYDSGAKGSDYFRLKAFARSITAFLSHFIAEAFYNLPLPSFISWIILLPLLNIDFLQSTLLHF